MQGHLPHPPPNSVVPRTRDLTMRGRCCPFPLVPAGSELAVGLGQLPMALGLRAEGEKGMMMGINVTKYVLPHFVFEGRTQTRLRGT